MRVSQPSTVAPNLDATYKFSNLSLCVSYLYIEERFSLIWRTNKCTFINTVDYKSLFFRPLHWWSPRCLLTRIQLVYRVIHKSLRDFRLLRYSSRDGHVEGEHVNRGRVTPSFCPTLQVLDMLTSEGSWQTFLAHARQSRPMAPAGLFVSQRTGGHSAGISCTTHELFCP